MVQRELKIRYKNSALGFLWSFINPLVTTAVLTLVFGYLMGNGIGSFSAYILAAYLPFIFFQQSVLDSAQSVLLSLPLVKKIYFPREILPLAAIISNFVHMLLGFVVFFLFLLVIYLRHRDVVPFQATTVYLPLLMILSLAMATGMGLLVSALNTFYEDVKYITGIILNLLFFLSPITYLSEQVAYSPFNQQSNGLVYQLYHINPVAALATAYRHALLAPQGPVVGGVKQAAIPLDPKYMVWTTLFSFFMLWFGYFVFNRMKWRFVERP
jgi:ABC-2 type transport system permease protein